MPKNNARNAANKVVTAIASKIKDNSEKGAKNDKKSATTQTAPKTEKGAKNVFLLKGAAQDALLGRVGARTHAIHQVLLQAALTASLLKTSEITSLATAFMQRTDKTAECNATNSHLNTMREQRAFVQRKGGAWRLTDEALELCGAKWGADVKQSKKSKK